METYKTVLEFWFGVHADDSTVASERAKLWWRKNPQTDLQIRERFETCVLKAENRELDALSTTPAGCLALIILTDQFSRHIYRNTPNAFSFDPLALMWSKEGIERGFDKLLRSIERVFFYLPLQHSESISDQDRSIVLYRELAAGAAATHKQTFDEFLDYAIRHRDIIARFGRFPHRNAIIGRESTPEELAFLKEHGSSF